MKIVLYVLLATRIQFAFPAAIFADERHGTATVVFDYRVEYKLRNRSTGAAGETNAMVELRQQNPVRT